MNEERFDKEYADALARVTAEMEMNYGIFKCILKGKEQMERTAKKLAIEEKQEMIKLSREFVSGR